MTSPGGAATRDGDLLARVASGDERAFETLYGRYAAAVRAFVRVRVPDAGTAVTLVRLVFILACDVVFGLMVTAVMGAQGYGTFGVLLVGWLSPLLLVAGVGAMLAIRFSTGVGFGVGLLLVAVIRTDLLGLTGLPAAGWIDMTRPFGQPLLAVTGLMACAAAVAFSGRLSEARMAAAAV